LDYGELLCHRGQKEQGINVLKRAKAGFEKMGQKNRLEQAQKRIDSFSN